MYLVSTERLVLLKQTILFMISRLVRKRTLRKRRAGQIVSRIFCRLLNAAAARPLTLSVFGVGFLEQRAQLLFSRGLLLLHELGMTFGDPPAIGSGHGRAQRASGRGLQLLPVITTGPEEHSDRYS